MSKREFDMRKKLTARGFPWDILKTRTIDGIEGLVLVVAQDSRTDRVLMVAFTNMEGIKKTLKTGNAHYFSTSRNKSWMKGETSGNVQKVESIHIDCDADVLLMKVKQVGGACHEGYISCFYRKIGKDGLEVIENRVFDPEMVY